MFIFDPLNMNKERFTNEKASLNVKFFDWDFCILLHLSKKITLAENMKNIS